jgi:hypothetical protein
MANPTTNFGWVMPTSTDLVTDLPADFNVFGQGVDTSMQYLLGGTTGQVLSKTSGTNMAFTWVTPTDQTPLTTKGDLFTFSTVDARLAVGTNKYVLGADSTQSTGLAWQTSPQSIMTTTGDTLYASAANTPARLGIGSTGQVLTVASGIPSWATPATPAFSGAFVTKNTTQTITTASTYFAVSFQAETYDTGSFHDNTTNNSRLTVPTAGYYRFQFATVATNAQFYRLGFFKNGTQVNTGYSANGDQGTTGMSSIDLLLAATDYVEIMVYIAGSSTGFYGTNSLTVPTYFSCQYLGA